MNYIPSDMVCIPKVLLVTWFANLHPQSTVSDLICIPKVLLVTWFASQTTVSDVVCIPYPKLLWVMWFASQTTVSDVVCIPNYGEWRGLHPELRWVTWFVPPKHSKWRGLFFKKNCWWRVFFWQSLESDALFRNHITPWAPSATWGNPPWHVFSVLFLGWF